MKKTNNYNHEKYTRMTVDFTKAEHAALSEHAVMAGKFKSTVIRNAVAAAIKKPSK